MPELPEVETTRRGIAPHAVGQTIEALVVHEPRLRWPVPAQLPGELEGRQINAIRRRGKYLLFDTNNGTALLHLGMSGSLRVVDAETPLRKHDHVEFVLSNARVLRFHDPRRFGSLLWAEDAAQHPLLKDLGPEPLNDGFDGDWLKQRAGSRRVAVKVFIMNAHTVVGVGNIYASEALFRAGINPRRQAARISLDRYRKLAESIRDVLAAAIKMGGTTLRDFYGADGSPGYFRQVLNVYERESKPCRSCSHPVRRIVLGQRATYYCPKCQV